MSVDWDEFCDFSAFLPFDGYHSENDSFLESARCNDEELGMADPRLDDENEDWWRWTVEAYNEVLPPYFLNSRNIQDRASAVFEPGCSPQQGGFCPVQRNCSQSSGEASSCTRAFCADTSGATPRAGEARPGVGFSKFC